jgi:hypothetical protein
MWRGRGREAVMAAMMTAVVVMASQAILVAAVALRLYGWARGRRLMHDLTAMLARGLPADAFLPVLYPALLVTQQQMWQGAPCNTA